MLRVLKALALVTLIGAFAFLSTQRTDAAIHFAPSAFAIDECGVIGAAPSSLDLDGNGMFDDFCRVWYSGSSKQPYTVPGISRLERGAVVHVRADICTVCKTSCHAGVLWNATLSKCRGNQASPGR